MPASPHYAPAPTFPSLGDGFSDAVQSAEFPQHIIRHRDTHWADRVGLGDLTDNEWIAHFGRFQALPDNLPEPLAVRYHGHQFRVYNPEIGDGRGFLFAQLRDPKDNRLLDLGTKGTGTTPYSRGGDGRLTLKGGVRELMATSMLEALGVYTSKTFSLIETGEALQRNDEPSPTRGAAMVRLSHSHIRFGNFQRQAYLQDGERIQKLVDYAIAHYVPVDPALTGDDRTAAFLSGCVANCARLAAEWMVAGFVHGVLNTDNMVVTGESFDYGPWRFLPKYDPGFTAAYFDQTGLYSYGSQPSAVAWNLQQLAQTLTLICEKDPLVNALNGFSDAFHAELHGKLFARLGLTPPAVDAEREFAQKLYQFLHASQMGFEQFFFDWYGGMVSENRAAKSPEADAYKDETFAPVKAVLASLTPSHPGQLDHTYFKGEKPCTMLIEEVEDIWAAIAENDDWSKLDAKLDSIAVMSEGLKLARGV
ncbi:MAG: YdiU family protein [Proteobacteria bacterium]|nr:YdiU family protein [Pseudomonadota bacterium]